MENKFINDTLGNRMKKYENVTREYLNKKSCVIIRLDGRAFHTFTKGLNRPFDKILSETMSETMKVLCNEIQGCVFGYTQSDEISLLITDLDKLDSQAWFGNNLSKLISISASLCTLHFNRIYESKVFEYIGTPGFSKDYYETMKSKICKAIFDSRAFNIPIVEVTNYFIWRQNDAIKNAITMAASTKFSHKELQGVSTADRILKMSSIGLDYNKEYETKYRMGVACYKELVKEDKPKVFILDYEMPKITECKQYLDSKFVHLFQNIDIQKDLVLYTEYGQHEPQETEPSDKLVQYDIKLTDNPYTRSVPVAIGGIHEASPFAIIGDKSKNLDKEILAYQLKGNQIDYDGE